MKRWTQHFVVVVLALFHLGWAHADAPPSEVAAPSETLQLAKQHFSAGKDAYTAGKYAVAIREFKAAEAIRPSPILSYNIGLANEKLGHRKLALQYYQSYLAALPDAANRPEVEERIAKLQSQPPQSAGTAPAGSDTPPPAYPPYAGGDPYAQQQPVNGQPPPPPAPKKSLWWVWLLVGIGGALVLTTIIVVATVYANASNDRGTTSAHLTPPGNHPGFMPSTENSSRTPAPTLPIFSLHF